MSGPEPARDPARFGRRLDLAYRVLVVALVGLWLAYPPARGDDRQGARTEEPALASTR